MTDGGLGEVREYMRARLTEDRNLDPDELAALAEALAGHPELWRGFVQHNAEERIYTEIHRDHHLDVWLICWSGAQQTGLHDHDLSGGAVRVIEGELAEDRLVFGSGVETVGYSGRRRIPVRLVPDPRRAPHRRDAGGVAAPVLAAAVADGVLRRRATTDGSPAGRRATPRNSSCRNAALGPISGACAVCRSSSSLCSRPGAPAVARLRPRRPTRRWR